MRIQLIALLCIFSFSVHASDDKSMKELFAKYDQIMDEHKVELVDEVFTQKFLESNGGKEEFIAKVKEIPKVKKRKGLRSLLQKWKKSKVGRIFFAKVKDTEVKPGKSPHEAEFVVIEVDGKLKIDGTLSDGN